MTETTLERLRKSDLQSSYLEAALFSPATDLEIATLLELPVEVVTTYRAEFLPVSTSSKLEKLEQIELEMSNPKTKRRGTLKLWALANGLEFLHWRLGNSIQISPVDGMQKLFNICFYKAKEAMFSPSTSEEGRESQKWVKLSTDIARLIKLWVSDHDAAKKDLEVALAEINPNFDSLEKYL